MIRAGVIGLGKMGISHCAVFNAQPDVDVVAVCDTTSFTLALFDKYTEVACFSDYKALIDNSGVDCVVVATPPSSHGEIVRYALERDLHVFCEKPFTLDLEEGIQLATLARSRQLVTQVGYHCRFIGTFQRVKQLMEARAIGDPYHFAMEVRGNVVKKKRGMTWRSRKAEGGGCLYDYGSHGIDLIAFLLGAPTSVTGTLLRTIYSRDTEDAIYTTLSYESGLSGHLAANWCDPTCRKMETQITIMGTDGKVTANRQEGTLFISRAAGQGETLPEGWSTFYATDVTKPVRYYLRGEEYSAQVEHFVRCIAESELPALSSFESAVQTDRVLAQVAGDGGRSREVTNA